MTSINDLPHPALHLIIVCDCIISVVIFRISFCITLPHAYPILSVPHLRPPFTIEIVYAPQMPLEAESI